MVLFPALQIFMDLCQQAEEAILQYNLQTGKQGQEEGEAKMSAI